MPGGRDSARPRGRLPSRTGGSSPPGRLRRGRRRNLTRLAVSIYRSRSIGSVRCVGPETPAFVHSQEEDHPISVDNPRVNDQIRISPIRLIDAEGEQLGVVSLTKARETAEEVQLDLVEVAPMARPPVVRLMDWGKHRFELQKKKREDRKKQHQTEVKEVQLRPRTDDHDFDTKLRRARKFLEAGNVVRVVLRFRGRELRRPEVGEAQLDKMVQATEDLARLEHRSKAIEGRRLIAILEPVGN